MHPPSPNGCVQDFQDPLGSPFPFTLYPSPFFSWPRRAFHAESPFASSLFLNHRDYPLSSHPQCNSAQSRCWGGKVSLDERASTRWCLRSLATSPPTELRPPGPESAAVRPPAKL